MSADDDATPQAGAFGDFSIDGLNDPIAPRVRPDYVELSDPDQPSIPELPVMYGRLLGGAPWSGLHTATGGRRRVASLGAVLVALVLLVIVVSTITVVVRTLN